MGKTLSSKLFSVKENVTVSCRCEDTRYGFRHLATLLVNGSVEGQAKACYYNRTWESYEFQSVIKGLAYKFEKSDPDLFKAIYDFARDGGIAAKQDMEEVNKRYGLVATMAALGSLLTDTQAEANDWKARMLKAGLGNSGLEMPADWDTLPEDEKTRRLDAVIKELQTVPVS